MTYDPENWADQVAAMPKSLTAAEAAILMRMHGTTVRTLARQGEIPAVRLGGGRASVWRFSKSRLLDLLGVELDAGCDPTWEPAVAALPEVLSSTEAALVLRLNEQTVRVLAGKGEVPGRRVVRTWRFSKSRLLDLLGVELDPPPPSSATDTS